MATAAKAADANSVPLCRLALLVLADQFGVVTLREVERRELLLDACDHGAEVAVPRRWRRRRAAASRPRGR